LRSVKRGLKKSAEAIVVPNDKGRRAEPKIKDNNRSCNMKAGIEKREEKPKAHGGITARKAGGQL
jgi:hypothetical protein